MPRFINPVPQYLDDAGNPLAEGKLFFFESGTGTDKDTFADVNEKIDNTNPVILSGSGRAPNIFYTGDAKVILSNADETQFWERDPVSTGGSEGAIGDDWDSITIYNINDVAELSGVFYVSITNNNQNNNPASTASAWTQFDLLKRWNTLETYNAGDPVTAGGRFYTSAAGSNLGNDPATDNTGKWISEAGKTENLLIGNFRVNQREVSGSVVLGVGVYGHDRFRGGSAGCSYTFATSANVTTITISVGTLEQVIEGANIQSGTHVLGWEGTAQGRIDGGSYGALGVTATLTGGTNAVIEFNDNGTGTISSPRLREGAVDAGVDDRLIGDELDLCLPYFEPITGGITLGIAPAMATSATAILAIIPFSPKRAAPTITFSGSFGARQANTVVVDVTANSPLSITTISAEIPFISGSGLVAGNFSTLTGGTLAAGTIFLTSEL